MSKENGTKSAELTADNVMDVINKGNLVDSVLVTSVMDKIKKEQQND